MILFLAAQLLAEPVLIGKFTSRNDALDPWRVVKVSNIKPTIYRRANVAGVSAIEARVDKSMALLAVPINVDLSKTPVLCWRWYVDGVVAKADMSKKAGNDFAARLYVAFDIPDSELSAGTKMTLGFARRVFGMQLPDAAVTYVWDNRNAVGVARRSPYTDRQQLVVAQSGGGRAGEWVAERVDVAADFARWFGKHGRPVQLAVASDGDNTKSKGLAAFSDIHFVRRDQACLI